MEVGFTWTSTSWPWIKAPHRAGRSCLTTTAGSWRRPKQELPQILPAPGLVEHDPEAIWSSQLDVARQAMAKAAVSAGQIAALGVTNQRETTILWDRHTGRPVANAVVWQSRASTAICERLKAEGLEATFRARRACCWTPISPARRSSTCLDAHEGSATEPSGARFSSAPSIPGSSGGSPAAGATSPICSNASRTLMFNIHTLDWDDELLAMLDIPRAMLPEVRPSSEIYGQTDDEWLGGPIPIAGDVGDQQAATFGQACFQPGAAKNTYGTGCFLLLNTGKRADRLATSPADHDRLGARRPDNLLPGRVGFHRRRGRAVASRRAGHHRKLGRRGALAARVPDAGGVYFVPAFVGLGAPYWDPHARGTILGITRGTTAAHLARAALESMAYQTRDVLDAMQKDAGIRLAELKVDGGASVNHLLMQFQADMLGVPVRRPVVAETTALGAAYLAGLAVGYWQDTADLVQNWALDQEYRPQLSSDRREAMTARWRKAVRRSLDWE